MKLTCFLKTLVLISVLFMSSPLHGQKPSTRIVTAEDFLGKKLPPEVYDIEIDTNGFVYFVFPGGIWKFNGFSIEYEWKLENPFEQNYYFYFAKGFNNQILLTGPFGLGYIKEDSILKFPVPDSILKFGKRGFESVYNDKEGLLHVAPRYKGHYTIDSLGNASEVMVVSSGVHGFVVTTLPDGELFHYSVRNYKANKPFSLYILDSDSNLQFISEVDIPIYESSLVQYQDGTFMFSNGNYDIIHFDDKGLIKAHVFDHKVMKLFIDSEDALWIGTIDNGVFKSKTAELIKLERYLDNTAAAVVEGFDRGIWFKSNVVKFGYKPSLEILNYSDQTGYPMFKGVFNIEAGNRRVIVQNHNLELFIVDGDEVNKIIPPGIDRVEGKAEAFTAPTGFCYDEKRNTVWFAYYGELQGWNGSEWQIIKFDTSEFHNTRVSGLEVLQDGRIIGLTLRELFEIKNGEIIRISEHFDSNLLDFAIDEFGTFWVGSTEGLWIVEDGKFSRPFEEMPKNLLEQCVFVIYAHGEVWCQQLNSGVYRIRKDTIIPVFDQKGQRVQLYSQDVNANGDFWAVADMKLCRIETSGDSTNIHYFEFDDHALTYHNGWSLALTNNEIYIGSRDGLFKQRISDLTSNEIPSKVVVTEVRINYEKVPLKNSYNLSYDQNDLNITFNEISFRRMPVSYSYRMDGLDSIWHETNYKQVQYTNLSPGDYNFKLRIKTARTYWTKPVAVHFFIAKPYWQTWWFRISILVLSVVVVLLLIRSRIRFVRKKEAEKGRIALELSRLELRALKAQMNPHFIFNTLKSIQNRIIKGSKWEANDLLIRFSKLIRSSLEYSRNEFISLTEEITFLRNYLEIEKQRIPNKFDYEIIIENVSELEYRSIPSLLIQPICENAINYAFEEGHGKLTLKLNLLNEDLLEVQITDNGIGYFNMQGRGNKENKSWGLNIVQSRLDLFRSHDYSTSMLIEALDETTNRGTKVTLKLPCQ